MFRRNIESLLVEWKSRRGRKPLVIRGARQVGKTSAVQQFAARGLYGRCTSLSMRAGVILL